VQHIGRGITPAQTALEDLVQRCDPVSGELAKNLPGFHADLTSRLQALPRHPARHSRRRSHTNAFEAFLDGRVEDVL
jgi:hypothetical protein